MLGRPSVWGGEQGEDQEGVGAWGPLGYVPVWGQGMKDRASFSSECGQEARDPDLPDLLFSQEKPEIHILWEIS